jgi:hypothetical protein
MSVYYILEGHEAVKTDLMTWARMFKKADRVVRKTTIGDAEISTVFLGLDHQFGDGPPLLFETMVFGGKLDQKQDRCTTWEEAEAMHEAMSGRVRSNERRGRFDFDSFVWGKYDKE